MFSYISQDNKKAAENLRKKIYDKIKDLRQFPFKYPAVQEEDAPGVERGYRYMAVNPYLVFYRVMEDRIVIARVMHLKQNWLQILYGFQDEM
jgi:toxin ParE1/3/4